MIEEQLLFRISDVSGKPYYRISNSSNKVWLVPKGRYRKTNLSLKMYQPAATIGKIFKVVFPFLPNALKKKAATEINIDFDDKWLKEIYNKELCYSIFLGTPSPHQKSVVQVMDSESNIIGYLKYSNNEKVKEIISHEADMIKYLEEHNISGIPRILSFGTMNGYIYLLTDTKRNKHSKCEFSFSNLYANKLEHIYKNTYQNMKLSHIEFYQNAMENASNIGAVSNTEQLNAYKCGVDILKANSEKIYEMAFYHGDFKPWNCYINNNELYVFDFEYSQKYNIKYLDKIHFMSQINYLTKGQTAKDIVNEILSNTDLGGYTYDEKIFTILVYAMDMILLYILRAGEVNSEGVFYFNMLKVVLDLSKNGENK